MHYASTLLNSIYILIDSVCIVNTNNNQKWGISPGIKIIISKISAQGANLMYEALFLIFFYMLYIICLYDKVYRHFGIK